MKKIKNNNIQFVVTMHIFSFSVGSSVINDIWGEKEEKQQVVIGHSESQIFI